MRKKLRSFKVKLGILRTKIDLLYHALAMRWLYTLYRANILSESRMYKPYTKHFCSLTVDYAFLAAIGECDIDPKVIDAYGKIQAILDVRQ